MLCLFEIFFCSQTKLTDHPKWSKQGRMETEQLETCMIPARGGGGYSVGRQEMRRRPWC